MNTKKSFRVLRHACLMVARTTKSYALLSVTVVLSFSLLLGYLCYTDSSLLNRYKDLFSYRRGDILIYDDMYQETKFQTLLQQLSKEVDTQYHICYEGAVGRSEGIYQIEGMDDLSETVTLHNWYLLYRPDQSWTTPLWDLPTGEIVWTDGRSNEYFSMEADEAIINEGLYYALGFDQTKDPLYTFQFENGLKLSLKIVGYALDNFAPFTVDLENGTEGESYRNQLILSTKLISDMHILQTEGSVSGRYIIIHTDDPEHIWNLCSNLGYDTGISAFLQQNKALEQIRIEKSNKAIITCALLLLLGVNLYSCFTNALNDRKFEIGVKRAIGASSGSIVRQFLYESIIVMMVDIFISVVLVTDIFILYKSIYEAIPDQWGNLNQWILYISPESIAMFVVCSVSLTIVFSIIFAYKSTQVEIVQYLKAE